MRKFFKWYYDMWKNPENKWTGEDTIEMAWASIAILLGSTGLVILFILLFNQFP